MIRESALLAVALFFLLYYTEAVRTQRGNDVLVVDNYEWVQKGTSTDGSVRFYGCRRSTCRARAHRPIATDDFLVLRNHNHLPNPAKITANERFEQAKELATVQVNGNYAAPRDIYHEVTQGLTEEERQSLASYNGFRHMIQDQRFVPESVNVDKDNIREITFEGPYTVDLDGNPFVLHNSLVDAPAESVMFVFANAEGMQLLRRYDSWSIDGTFKVCPRNFLQLYIISVLVDESCIPVAYALLQDKRKETYVRLFNVIKDNIAGGGPRNLMLDFEQGAKSAAVFVWPHVTIKLCVFHLSQSIMRKVKQLHLMDLYVDDDQFKVNVRSLAALAFLPVNLVERGFNILNGQRHADSRALMNYFKWTYIRSKRGRLPMYPPAAWNHFHSVVNDLARTNNAIESTNLILRKHFTLPHPKVSKLIEILKTEDRNWKNQIHDYEANPAAGTGLLKRKKIQKAKDIEIKDIVIKFNALPSVADHDIVTFLKSIQYVLLKKDFTAWYVLRDDDDNNYEEDESESDAFDSQPAQDEDE